MKIIFFNTFHNGDLFFTKEYIRSIVNNNPEHKFFVICRQFYSIYSDIENLEVLERPNDIDGHIKSADIDLTKKYYIKDDALYINAMTAINNGTAEKPSIKYTCFIAKECMNQWFTDIINGANTLAVEPKLIFKNLSKEEFIPTILTRLKFNDLHSRIKSSLAGPCVFYYNIHASGAQTSFGDDDKNIESIASKYPSYTVIVPKETKIKMKNVLSLYDLNIRETPDGKNLLINAYVASFCSIIVTKETGGALVVFNKDMMKSNTDQYIILLFSEEGNTMFKKEYGISLIDGLKQFVLNNHKHLIPLSKYDPETLLGEIEKIGPVQPPKISLELSGGRRLRYRSKGRTKKNKRKIRKMIDRSVRQKRRIKMVKGDNTN